MDVRRYWFPPGRPAPAASVSAVHDELRALLFQSVKRRLSPDHPLLAHLSGGVDSSSIVCIAAEIGRADRAALPSLITVSARYPGLSCDEGAYIESVTSATPFPNESWNGLEGDFADLDAPSPAGPGLRSHRNDGSMGEFAIAERVGATAILSGNGGDHLGTPFGVTEERARRRPWRFALRTVASPAFTLRQRRVRTRFFLRLMAPPGLKRRVVVYRSRRDAPRWLAPRWRDLVVDLASAPPELPAKTFGSMVEEEHWRELTSARLGHALDTEQLIAAEHGVEMRYPFLDQDLVEFVLGLPADGWPPAYSHVRLHREALGALLPTLVRDRTTKAAFSPVAVHRLRRAAGRIRSLFYENGWAAERWVDRHAAQRLLERALAGSTTEWTLWQPLWAIATLEAWLRSVLR
jgi:asparagine synthase (glutamine-hydrolysing)